MSNLWLSGHEIDRSALARTVTVIHRITVRKTKTCVIAVIRNLIIHLSWSGIHLVQPVQTPFYLVKNIGNTVGTFASMGIVEIFENTLILCIFVAKAIW